MSGYDSEPLVLSEQHFARNSVALFEEFERDPAARQRFIENPAGELAAKVLRRELPPQRQSDTNRVLFALLANDEFMSWLADYPSSQGNVDPPELAVDGSASTRRSGIVPREFFDLREPPSRY